MDYHPTVSQIKSLLDENDCWYETFEHKPVKTSKQASEIRTGYSLSQGAKALIVKAGDVEDGQFVMLVLPGDKRFDNQKVRDILNTEHLRFATVDEISKITDGIKIGGVPPFGNLFDLPVFVDPSLLGNKKIIFNAGDRKYSIGMKSKDFQRLVKLELVDII